MTGRMRSVQIPRGVVTKPFRQAAESAGIYIVLCTAYILFSGYLAARIAKTPQQLHAIETYKGVSFIILTGLLFFAISFIRWRKIRQQEYALIKEETALLQAEKKLVAAMSAAMVAHDLNNLLMALSGLLEKLRNRDPDPALVAMSGQIEVNIDKLRRLVKRLETGIGRAISEKKENIDVKAAIHEMATVVRSHPASRSCRISTSEVAPVTLKLNRTLFEEAVLNLLINAAQATGPNGQIEVRLTTEPDAAVLAIHDNGPGVPDFLVRDIFEPCFTTKPGGTGLGLLAVSAFSASCGADLTVGRSPLGGAMFQFRIPMPNPPATPAAETAQPG